MVVSLAFVTALFVLLPTAFSSSGKPARTGPSPLAVLVHDSELLDQRPLLDASVAAARLALEKARLQAALAAQLEEVRASRARIVQAGVEERRKVERDLHDGAQQRLLALSLTIAMISDQLATSPAATRT